MKREKQENPYLMLNKHELRVAKFSTANWYSRPMTGADTKELDEFRSKMDEDADIVFIQNDMVPKQNFRGKLNKPSRSAPMYNKGNVTKQYMMDFWYLDEMNKPEIKIIKTTELF